jgi:hypothetical protein
MILDRAIYALQRFNLWLDDVHMWELADMLYPLTEWLTERFRAL